MFAVVGSLEHRVHVRQDHAWTFRCGLQADPWVIDGTSPIATSDSPCPMCSAKRANSKARQVKRAVTVSGEAPSTAAGARPRKDGAAKGSGTTPKACSACLQNSAVRGKGGYCHACSRKYLPSCGRCGKTFVPAQDAPRKTTCPTCRRNKGVKRSAWVVASAGSPGLGRRN